MANNNDLGRQRVEEIKQLGEQKLSVDPNCPEARELRSGLKRLQFADDLRHEAMKRGKGHMCMFTFESWNQYKRSIRDGTRAVFGALTGTQIEDGSPVTKPAEPKPKSRMAELNEAVRAMFARKS